MPKPVDPTPTPTPTPGGDTNNTTDGGNSTTNGTVIKPIEEDIVDLDDTTLPINDDVRVNWDGETIDMAWYEKEAFKIGDYSVTVGEVTKMSGVTVAIIFVSVAGCLFISWRKRKRIA